MRRVIVESPYAGNVAGNTTYARRAVADCLSRGETPLASHLLLTQPGILDDTVPAERELGIEAGLEWYLFADAAVVYLDHGCLSGMERGVARARAHGVEVEERWIGNNEPKPTKWQRLRCDSVSLSNRIRN